MVTKTEKYEQKITKHDKSILNVIFNEEAAGVSFQEFKNKVPKGTFDKFPATADNIIVDVNKHPCAHIDDMKLLNDFTEIERQVIELLEKSRNESNFSFKRILKKYNKNLLKIDFEQDIDLQGLLHGVSAGTALIGELLLKDGIMNKDIQEHGRKFAPYYNCLAQLKTIQLQQDIAIFKLKNGNSTESFEMLIKNEEFQNRENEIYSLLCCVINWALPEPEFDQKLDDVGVYRCSKLEATALKHAYSQFGSLMLIKAARYEHNIKLLENEHNGDNENMIKLLTKNKTFYETEASNCMLISGAFGNKIAKELATKINPFAKLCGSMVMQSIVNTFYDGSCNN